MAARAGVGGESLPPPDMTFDSVPVMAGEAEFHFTVFQVIGTYPAVRIVAGEAGADGQGTVEKPLGIQWLVTAIAEGRRRVGDSAELSPAVLVALEARPEGVGLVVVINTGVPLRSAFGSSLKYLSPPEGGPFDREGNDVDSLLQFQEGVKDSVHYPQGEGCAVDVHLQIVPLQVSGLPEERNMIVIYNHIVRRNFHIH